MQRLFLEAHSKRTKQCNIFRKGNFYKKTKNSWKVVKHSRLSSVHVKFPPLENTPGKDPVEPDPTFTIALLWVEHWTWWTAEISCLFLWVWNPHCQPDFSICIFQSCVKFFMLLKEISKCILHMLQSLFIFPPSDNEIRYLRGVGRRLSVKSCWVNCYNIKRWDSVQ